VKLAQKPDERVLITPSGRLFLYRDRNRTLDQHLGRLPFDAEGVESWAQILRRRCERLGRLGSSYCFLVAPNAHSIYNDELPEEYQSEAMRPVEQLAAELPPELGSIIVNPTDVIRSRRDEGIMYPLTDTHWSHRGAFVAYRHLLSVLTGVAPVAADRVSFKLGVFEGGLGRLLVPPRSSPTERTSIAEATSTCLYDNRVFNHGSILVFGRGGREPDAEPATRAIIFGDSFTWHLLPYIAETFDRLVWVHSTSIDFRLVELERPDAVISETTERFITRLPTDENFDFLQVAASKRATGRVRDVQDGPAELGPESPHWSSWMAELR
jgi:hypothetical protein